MFLNLNHQKLDIYDASKKLVSECYKLSMHLPTSEKSGMINQIRRAALSVHLNIAEGASRKSDVERKRFYEISRGSIIEIDAALDIANDLHYLAQLDTSPLKNALIRCFQIISAMINSK